MFQLYTWCQAQSWNNRTSGWYKVGQPGTYDQIYTLKEWFEERGKFPRPKIIRLTALGGK